MIARASAKVETGGRVTHLVGRPPLTLRQVHSDRPDTAVLCQVGSAAGPLAGDDLRLDLEVGAGGRARLTATGASIAQGRAAASPARLLSHVVVGAGACLKATPPPLVACAGSHTEVVLRIDLDAGASLSWRELVVLGRSGEPGGAVRIDWDVRLDGQPLLRQSVDLTDPIASAWPGMLRGRRVLATQLLVGSGVGGRTVVLSADAVAQQLEGGGMLLTVLAVDAADAESELARLRSAL